MRVIARWPQSARVLIIDHNDEQRMCLRGVLEVVGYDVYDAPSGRAGLELCRAVRPSIVVLDGEMPSIDGDAFVDAHTRDPRIAWIPLVLVTARDGAADSRFAAILRRPARARSIIGVVRTFARLEQTA